MKSIFLSLFSIVTLISFGQVTGLEQDCINAIPVCNSIYVQNITYVGYGQDDNEVPGGSCLAAGENNSVWYSISIDSSGILEFLIMPLTETDYDFALYRINSLNCSAVSTGQAPEVRCNFAANVPGVLTVTGIAAGGTGTVAGANDDQLLAPLNVVAGERYLLMVDNFLSSTTSGYTLDFSASTARIKDASIPEFKDSVTTTCQDVTELLLEFNNNIDCSSIAADGSDFVLSGAPGVSATHAEGTQCFITNGSSKVVRVTLSDTLSAGTYQISLATGTDGNSLTSACGNSAPPDSIQIAITNGSSPVTGFTHSIVNDTLYVTGTATGYTGISYYVHVMDTIGFGYWPIHYASTLSFSVPLHGQQLVDICQEVSNSCGTNTYCLNYFPHNGVAPTDTVYGRMYKSDGTPYSKMAPDDRTRVLLVRTDSLTGYVIIDDAALIDSSGYFMLTTQAYNFYVKAIPDSAYHPDESFAYYDSSLVIQDATLLHNGDPHPYLNVYTKAMHNIGGSGFISGFITNGAGKTGDIGDPVPGVILMLMNEFGNPIRYTITDADGYFAFPDLALLYHKIYVDRPGINNLLAPPIHLSSNFISAENLSFRLYEDRLALATAVEETDEINAISIYPNPTNGTLYIQSLLAGEYHATVINSIGKKVLQSTLQGAQPQQMDVSQLPSGTYFIRIEQGDEVSVKRIALFK